jgi:hypothetical protein
MSCFVTPPQLARGSWHSLGCVQVIKTRKRFIRRIASSRCPTRTSGSIMLLNVHVTSGTVNCLSVRLLSSICRFDQLNRHVPRQSLSIQVPFATSGFSGANDIAHGLQSPLTFTAVCKTSLDRDFTALSVRLGEERTIATFNIAALDSSLPQRTGTCVFSVKASPVRRRLQVALTAPITS